MFYTRLNVAKWVKHDNASLSNCTKYLPFIGWVVGTASALTYNLFSTFLPHYASIIISLLVSVLITGAFHEDGLADVCDGFGGGWNKDRILEIMKDSSIGAYGTIGLILLFATKVSLLGSLYFHNRFTTIILITITGHSLSRFVATTFLFTHKYARTSDQSKALHLTQAPNMSVLLVSALLGLAPLGLLAYTLNNYYLLALLLPCYMAKILLARYFQKWIDGYTGDCLGATQQIAEVVFYISYMALWIFI